MGLKNIGELWLAERTYYEFRRRIYQYTIENPEKADLIFNQFERLAKVFVELTGLTTREQRMDSTQIETNMKQAGRVSLAYDVITQAIKARPLYMLLDSHKQMLDPGYKIDTLYRLKGNEARTARLQEMIDLASELLLIVEPHPDILKLVGVRILDRFIHEQAVFDYGKQIWIAKNSTDIAADSLQSAYDHDSTYRNKSGKKHVGLVANLSETCADENPIQLITDYTVEKNIISDTDMLKNRLPGIKKRTGANDLNVDGGYWSGDIERISQEIGIDIHYTEMTGKEPASEKFIHDSAQGISVPI